KMSSYYHGHAFLIIVVLGHVIALTAQNYRFIGFTRSQRLSQRTLASTAATNSTGGPCSPTLPPSSANTASSGDQEELTLLHITDNMNAFA
ncbi:MAG: hypothetical protein OSA77_01470, partial [Halioglobus sp.]|nr:hypothetical protein [Halioglobus sp.]